MEHLGIEGRNADGFRGMKSSRGWKRFQRASFNGMREAIEHVRGERKPMLVHAKVPLRIITLRV
jgi:hypothetical protein